jgi:hypothetical protein
MVTILLQGAASTSSASEIEATKEGKEGRKEGRGPKSKRSDGGREAMATQTLRVSEKQRTKLSVFPFVPLLRLEQSHVQGPKPKQHKMGNQWEAHFFFSALLGHPQFRVKNLGLGFGFRI